MAGKRKLWKRGYGIIETGAIDFNFLGAAVTVADFYLDRDKIGPADDGISSGYTCIRARWELPSGSEHEQTTIIPARRRSNVSRTHEPAEGIMRARRQVRVELFTLLRGVALLIGGLVLAATRPKPGYGIAIAAAGLAFVLWELHRRRPEREHDDDDDS